MCIDPCKDQCTYERNKFMEGQKHIQLCVLWWILAVIAMISTKLDKFMRKTRSNQKSTRKLY